MSRKKDKDWFYHMRSHFAWIWTLTGVLFRAQLLLFYWLHRAVCLCSQSKQDSYCKTGNRTCFGGVPTSPEWAHPALACSSSSWGSRTSWHSLLTPRATEIHLFLQNLHLAKLQSTGFRAEMKGKCALHGVLLLSGHFIFTHLSQPMAKEGRALISCRRCFKTRSEAVLWSTDDQFPCWKLKGITGSLLNLSFKGHKMLPFRSLKFARHWWGGSRSHILQSLPCPS